ncbi:heparan-alpha-glucosaminide N-acetyltransferase domain-containing protein [Microbacterium invictum]|uniref:Heparan-alpha-glucosaminide N-acetyltransferase domain-containing protein n=1 Tax=Microbacterium invictum TaxID=515415 RepID=A0ABZ0V984_9MICO|nr:heparan-alpha-glucosaminide N-acetyltransferase domain-containing protein [Microbacterium invictum]WQB69256.1 heparan-alpha-glucosaminide N-acetyltransferase domain-containing protein [Microbacterium invictum]
MTDRPRGMLSRNWARLNGQGRLSGIDLARGLAVLGMFAAHLLVTPELLWEIPSTWLGLVDGRSSILFATLAGVSIGLVTGGPRPFGREQMAIARMRLAVRAGMLWSLGVLLIATGVPLYVILPAYAIMFVLTLPFTRLSAAAVLVTAAGVGAVMPWIQVLLDEAPLWSTPLGDELSAALGWHYPFPVWMAFVLAGLGLARADLTRLRVQLIALAAGVGLAILGYGLDTAGRGSADAVTATLWSEVWTAEPHSSGLLEVIGSGGFAMAVIAGSLLVCRTVLVWIVLPLRAVGAMPLTAYTAQIVVWAIIALVVFGNTGLLTPFRELEPFWPLTLGIVVACTAWALVIGRGPLEWTFDRVSKLIVPTTLTRGSNG